jgi:hypothetical protein
MTPPTPAEQSLSAELRSSALLLGLLLVVVVTGIGLGLLSGLVS